MSSSEWNDHWIRIRNIGVTPTRLNIFRNFKTIPLLSGSRVLDVGCGSGTLADYWYKKGYDILAGDCSKEAIGLTLKRGLRCTFIDITKKLPFSDDSFDLVYSDGLLEHFRDPTVALNEMWRVSCEYLLTLVPRRTLYNKLHNIVFKPPREFNRSEEEWITIHREFLKPQTLEYRYINFGILWILCRK